MDSQSRQSKVEKLKALNGIVRRLPCVVPYLKDSAHSWNAFFHWTCDHVEKAGHIRHMLTKATVFQCIICISSNKKSCPFRDV